MKNLSKIKKFLPIEHKDLVLKPLDFNSIDWYIDNCRQSYYEKYNDFKFSTDIKEDKLYEHLYKLVKGYITNDKNISCVRCIIHKQNEIIGCITVVEKEDNIELAYSIIPKYWGRGYATNMLKCIINNIIKYKLEYKNIILEIREDNTKSIKVAERLGFEVLYIKQGKIKNNIIYALNKR